MSFKSGIIAVSGRPNAGKSTLINAITGQKVSIVSEKPQTTRNSIRAILTTEEYQLVIIDTPGIHKPRNKLGDYMVNSANETLEGADVIVVIVEPYMKESFKDEEIIRNAEKKAPVILVINKIDTIRREELLPVIEHYVKMAEYKAIIPVSAKNGDGIDIVLKEILNLLHEGPKYYPEEYITDKSEKFVASELIREKLLYLLNEEIPHGIGIEISRFEKRSSKDIIDIDADIYCEKESHKRIIIGKNGSVLKKTGEMARIDIESMLDKKVCLKLWVKVKKDWRDNSAVLRMLGYDRN